MRWGPWMDFCHPNRERLSTEDALNDINTRRIRTMRTGVFSRTLRLRDSTKTDLGPERAKKREAALEEQLEVESARHSCTSSILPSAPSANDDGKNNCPWRRGAKSRWRFQKNSRSESGLSNGLTVEEKPSKWARSGKEFLRLYFHPEWRVV